MYSVFLSSFSKYLLAFYHECRPVIGYATHVLFCDRCWVALQRALGAAFSCFRSVLEENLDESFERLVDLY